jgi:hypothetical protein
MNVRMEKIKLLSILETNKKEHVELYQEAKQGYLLEAKKLLKQAVKKLNDTGVLNYYELNLIEPVSYEETYSEIIEMLKHTQDSEISLTQSEFRNYVMDKWSWGSSFVTNNSAYMSGDGMKTLSSKY